MSLAPLDSRRRREIDGASKHTKRTGVRKRAEAAAEFAMPTDEYRNAYREFFMSLLPAARLALQRQIVARVAVCGNAGLIDDPAEYERLISEGLLPYTEPVALDDGIVPADAVQIHGRCVSRRSLIAYLEARAEVAGHAPPLFDGTPVTRQDMALLDLDADDYRFFNANRRRTRPQDAVAYEAPAQDINEDDDNDDDDDFDDEVVTLRDNEAEIAYDRLRSELITLRIDMEIEDVDEQIEIIIDPSTALREMITILVNTVWLPIELNDEDAERLLPEFGVHSMPLLEGFESPWEGFEEYVPLNLNVGTRQVVSEMIATYYLNDEQFVTPERHTLMLEKLRYILFTYTIGVTAGDDEVLIAYQYYPYEICLAIQYALKWNDIAVLRLLDEWIHRETPELNSNLGHQAPCRATPVAREFEEYRQRYAEEVRSRQPQRRVGGAPVDPTEVNLIIQRIIHYESELRTRGMRTD